MRSRWILGLALAGFVGGVSAQVDLVALERQVTEHPQELSCLDTQPLWRLECAPIRDEHR